jgi:3-hydroxyacyl-CoA dehydrogenase
VQRLVYALVNEGAHILEDGIASKSGDIDMVYLTGYGFPCGAAAPCTTRARSACSTWPGHGALCPEPNDDAKFWQPAPLLARWPPKASLLLSPTE